MTKSSPNKVFINATERSAKISAKDQKRKSTEAVRSNDEKVSMPTNRTHLQLTVLIVDMTEVFYLTKLQKTFLWSIYKN